MNQAILLFVVIEKFACQLQFQNIIKHYFKKIFE